LRQRRNAGKNAAPSPRHYFMGGSSDWAHQLIACLKSRGVAFRLGRSPIASLGNDGSWQVTSVDGQGDGAQAFDHIISAVYADVVPTVLGSGLPPSMPKTLASIRYYDSMAIVHHDQRMLPQDRAAWSTY